MAANPITGNKEILSPDELLTLSEKKEAAKKRDLEDYICQKISEVYPYNEKGRILVPIPQEYFEIFDKTMKQFQNKLEQKGWDVQIEDRGTTKKVLLSAAAKK